MLGVLRARLKPSLLPPMKAHELCQNLDVRRAFAISQASGDQPVFPYARCTLKEQQQPYSDQHKHFMHPNHTTHGGLHHLTRRDAKQQHAAGASTGAGMLEIDPVQGQGSRTCSRTGLYSRASGPQLWVLLCIVCDAVQKEHMGGMCSRPLSRVVALVREMRMVPVATTGLILIDSCAGYLMLMSWRGCAPCHQKCHSST